MKFQNFWLSLLGCLSGVFRRGGHTIFTENGVVAHLAEWLRRRTRNAVGYPAQVQILQCAKLFFGSVIFGAVESDCYSCVQCVFTQQENHHTPHHRATIERSRRLWTALLLTHPSAPKPVSPVSFWPSPPCNAKPQAAAGTYASNTPLERCVHYIKQRLRHHPAQPE